MNPKKIKTIRKSKKSRKLSKKSRKSKKSKKPKTARKQKTKKIKSCCTSQQNRLLLELVKSTKINGYKQDGGGVTDFLKDFMNNKVINQFKKPKNPENSKLNLKISNKYDVKSLQERLDQAISNYRYSQEQQKLELMQGGDTRNEQDGGEYKIADDAQVGGVQQENLQNFSQSDNSYTFDDSKVDTGYSPIYGGYDNQLHETREIVITGGSTKHQKWMQEVGQVKKEQNLGFYQALKEASKLRKDKKEDVQNSLKIQQQGGEIIEKNDITPVDI